MKKYFAPAALAAALLGTAAQAQMGGPAPSSGPKPQSHQSAGKVGKAVGEQLNAAQKAMAAKDTAGALAAVKAAQALPDKNEYETYVVNKFLSIVEINVQDYPAATVAAEAAADSTAMPDEDKADMYHNALLLSSQANQFPKAIAYGQALEAIGKLDDVTEAMLAVAYYQSKDEANAEKYAQMSIDASKAAGKSPQQNALIIQTNIEGKKNPNAARQGVEQMAVNSNDPEEWNKLIDDALSHKGVKPIDALYLFRLRYIVGGMKSEDYTILATLASQMHLDKEAATVLEQGISSGKITAGQAGSMYNAARNNAAKDAGILSAVAAAAEKAKTGQDAARLAEDYWGYGRYADVETTARLASSKGGLKDASEASMLLGMAQTAQGKTSEAQATLGSVSGDQGRTRAAQLWALYAQAKGKAAGAAPAAH
jgi:hypothetical protein